MGADTRKSQMPTISAYGHPRLCSQINPGPSKAILQRTIIHKERAMRLPKFTIRQEDLRIHHRWTNPFSVRKVPSVAPNGPRGRYERPGAELEIDFHPDAIRVLGMAKVVLKIGQREILRKQKIEMRTTSGGLNHGRNNSGTQRDGHDPLYLGLAVCV